MTPHEVGQIIRRKLQLKTEKRHGSYVIAASEGPKLIRLFERYGIESTPGNRSPNGCRLAAAPAPAIDKLVFQHAVRGIRPVLPARPSIRGHPRRAGLLI